MIVITVLIILALAGFCMLASDDLLRKSELTWHSWAIVIFMVCAVVGCLLICGESVRTQSIRDFTEGKYKLEEVVHSDTTYLVKRIKPNE